MGGNSSKQKITSASQSRGSNTTVSTITTINTIDTNDDGGVILGGKKHKQDKKKSKSKDKAKLKNTEKKKRARCKDHMRISFEEKTVCGVAGGGGNSGAYRKKSACPSCDARDMLMEQIRSRSGSLRYSDFNKIVRQSRIYDLDENPSDIPLDGVLDPLPETVCFICGVYTGSVTRTCRVCCHVYHNGCLQKIGQAMDQKALQLAQMDLWSCHQCSDTSRLLTREETHYTFNCLEELQVDPDNVTIKDYVRYKEKICSTLGRAVNQEKKLAWIQRFHFVAGDGDTLDWSQFLQAETISILRNRCKDSLVKLMTEMEFAQARKMFREMGKAGNNVAMAQVKDRITQLYIKFGLRPWPEDEEDIASLEEADFDRIVSWSEFLSLLAIHMITVRENNPAPISPTKIDDHHHDNNNANNEDKSPSMDSVDDDDDRTCDSDLDSQTTATTSSSHHKKTHKKNLSDVQTLNDSNNISDSEADKSISILDDLSKTFNLGGNCTVTSNQQSYDQHQNSSNYENIAPQEEENLPTRKEASSTTTDTSIKPHLWRNPSKIRDNPHFTTTMDVPVAKDWLPRNTKSMTLDKSPMIAKRQSEVLVRPSTEEGRSPRKALSQKLVAPAYGLVDKVQSQDWQC